MCVGTTGDSGSMTAGWLLLPLPLAGICDHSVREHGRMLKNPGGKLPTQSKPLNGNQPEGNPDDPESSK